MVRGTTRAPYNVLVLILCETDGEVGTREKMCLEHVLER